MPYTEHPQEDLLIVEALVYLGHDLEDVDPQRSRQAWRLAEDIVEGHSLDLTDAVLQIDSELYRSASCHR